ncbi:hypothetical protein, partial [Polycladomyces subterraneus]
MVIYQEFTIFESDLSVVQIPLSHVITGVLQNVDIKKNGSMIQPSLVTIDSAVRIIITHPIESFGPPIEKPHGFPGSFQGDKTRIIEANLIHSKLILHR